MALNFPNSPTANQIYTDSTTGNRYTWDAVRKLWKYSATTGNRSIAQRGFARIFCVFANNFVVSGTGVT